MLWFISNNNYYIIYLYTICRIQKIKYIRLSPTISHIHRFGSYLIIISYISLFRLSLNLTKLTPSPTKFIYFWCDYYIDVTIAFLLH